jgi:hypothetical protein
MIFFLPADVDVVEHNCRYFRDHCKCLRALQPQLHLLPPNKPAVALCLAMEATAVARPMERVAHRRQRVIQISGSCCLEPRSEVQIQYTIWRCNFVNNSLSCLKVHNFMFCWPCIIVYQYSETDGMHFLFSLLRIKGLYVFRALLAQNINS